MKRLLLTIALAFVCALSFARIYQKDKYNTSMMKVSAVPTRTEIILPEVNGYKIIKTDLHVHTCYSDGAVTPAYSVTEGWQNGLDAMAITDHIEYRPNEKKMQEFLADEIIVKENKDKNLRPDYNFSVSEAKAKARSLGLTIIPGIEITREAVKIGHFNALFTTDNNLIPDPDPLQAVRNAKKQGAIVQNNHPGWRRENNDFTEVTKAAIKEGLIDGVEVFNSLEFYPDVIETAINQNLYICAGTDIHHPFQDRIGRFGAYRNMTFVFAKDASLSSIREGLENHRTLAYAYGEIAGSEELLKDFFKASFDFTVLNKGAKGAKQIKITNKTSLPYVLSLPSLTVNPTIDAFSSIIITVKEKALPITIDNMWFGPDKHPEVIIPL